MVESAISIVFITNIVVLLFEIKFKKMVVEIKQPKINKYQATYLLSIRGATNVRSDGPSGCACADIHRKSRMRGYLLKVTHAQTTGSYINPGTEQSLVNMESNKRIPCKQCEKSYVQRKDLLRHIRNQHGKEQSKSRSLLKRRVVDHSGGATKKIKLRPPSPMVIVDDPEIKVFVQKNIEAIQKRKRVHRACQSFNFPLKSNNITPGLLLTHLNEIYDQASGKFKEQMGIGRILRNKENGELKYWRAEHCDSHLLQNQKVVQPMKVNSRSDLKQIAEKASNLATEDYLESTRPDTKWELVMPTNVRYYISYMDFVAGYITENLPDYLLKKESVNCLNRDHASHNNSVYQDKLCFFRCLAYHKLKHDKDHKPMCIGRPLNLLTHQLYYDYNKDVNQHRNQEQVGLHQLLELEAYFKINIEVYRCHEDSNNVDHVYKSVDELGRGKKLYLDLYVGDDENHFSYINNMQAYSHRFQLLKCEQDFRTSFDLNRHETVCGGNGY